MRNFNTLRANIHQQHGLSAILYAVLFTILLTGSMQYALAQ